MKHIIITSLLLVMLTNVNAGNNNLLHRKVGQKLYSAANEMKVEQKTEVVFTITVDEEGKVTTDISGCEEKMKQLLGGKLSDLHLKKNFSPGTYTFKATLLPDSEVR
ncbi:MAG: hypothetical protein ACOZCO_16710 [Bacteroidota bacterium]